jgi:hypothetical protein
LPYDFFQSDVAISDEMIALELDNFTPIPLMFQTGYLTVDHIKRINKAKIYFLRFPNYEIKSSFYAYLLSDLTLYNNHTDLIKKAQALSGAILEKDSEKTALAFSVLLATIPYRMHVSAEAYYHTIFYFTLELLGQPINVEESVGDGVLDAVIDIPGGDILVVEMKYIKSPKQLEGNEQTEQELSPETQTISKEEQKLEYDELAMINQLLDEGAVKVLRQIDDKRYALKYLNNNRTITKVAMIVCKRTYVKVVFKDILNIT